MSEHPYERRQNDKIDRMTTELEFYKRNLSEARAEIKQLKAPEDIFNNKRFVGLWSYRPYKGKRKYCATVIIDGEPTETHMHDEWVNAVKAAGELLNDTR